MIKWYNINPVSESALSELIAAKVDNEHIGSLCLLNGQWWLCVSLPQMVNVSPVKTAATGQELMNQFYARWEKQNKIAT